MRDSFFSVLITSSFTFHSVNDSFRPVSLQNYIVNKISLKFSRPSQRWIERTADLCDLSSIERIFITRLFKWVAVLTDGVGNIVSEKRLTYIKLSEIKSCCTSRE